MECPSWPEMGLGELAAELHKATMVIDIQKKVATLLGVTIAMPPNDAG